MSYFGEHFWVRHILILVGVLDRDFYGEGETVSCAQSLGQVEGLQGLEFQVGRDRLGLNPQLSPHNLCTLGE